MSWEATRKWFQEHVVGSVVTAILVAILAFLAGLVSVPSRLGVVEERVKTLDSISQSVGELKGSKDALQKAATDAGTNVEKLRTETEKHLDDFRKDTSDLRSEINSLEKSNSELRLLLQSLKTDVGKVDDLRKSVDDLRVTVGNLDLNVKRNADVIANLAQISARLEKVPVETEVRTLVCILDNKHLIEAGRGVWEFRVSVPEDNGRVSRVLQTTAIAWSPALADATFEYQQRDRDIRIIMRGTTLDPAKRAVLDQMGGIPVQMVVAMSH